MKTKHHAPLTIEDAVCDISKAVPSISPDHIIEGFRALYQRGSSHNPFQEPDGPRDPLIGKAEEYHPPLSISPALSDGMRDFLDSVGKPVQLDAYLDRLSLRTCLFPRVELFDLGDRVQVQGDNYLWNCGPGADVSSPCGTLSPTGDLGLFIAEQLYQTEFRKGHWLSQGYTYRFGPPRNTLFFAHGYGSQIGIHPSPNILVKALRSTPPLPADELSASCFADAITSSLSRISASRDGLTFPHSWTHQGAEHPRFVCPPVATTGICIRLKPSAWALISPYIYSFTLIKEPLGEDAVLGKPRIVCNVYDAFIDDKVPMHTPVHVTIFRDKGILANASYRHDLSATRVKKHIRSSR